MYIVYVIQSIQRPDKIYVGYTSNIEERLGTHNSGGSIYTKDYKPWQLVFHGIFKEKSKALAFEKYLKSHTGRAFLIKRLT